MIDCSHKYCIVGAGPSGLAVAKNFRQQGIPCDCIERNDDVGGNWYYGTPTSSVCRSTHLISSKGGTEFADFPMPADYPQYPSQRQAWDYLKDYARHFGLYELIEFGSEVVRIEPAGDAWRVQLADGPPRVYRGVVIANGHNWDPNWPDLPGDFAGQMLHAGQYKTPEVLEGRRVLVIGAGNSGCDIAVEAAQHADATIQSMRRGYHYLPKFVAGRPVDAQGEWLLRMRFPLWLRRWITHMVVKYTTGLPEDFSLPPPDHRLFETHPIVNSQLLYFVGHGRIKVKPDVAALCGDDVQFADDSREAIDLIICATGYKISFPFIDRAHLNWRDGRPDLHLNVFHPQYDNLFVAGLIQPDSGQWGLVDYQAQLIARVVHSQSGDRREATRRLGRDSNHRVDLGHGIRYVPSPRHLLEVEHFSYRRRLKKLIAGFD